MKTYILRDPSRVEPQTARGLEPPDAATAALAERSVAAARPSSVAVLRRVDGPALYIGLDVHTESMAVSVAPRDATEVRRYGLIGGTHDDVLRLAKKLQAAHPGVTLRFVYEAGPHGYPLGRCLRAHGYDCRIVAPSKIPRAPDRDRFKYRQAFDPGVFQKEEEEMKRKRLARRHNTAAALGLKLVPAQ